MTVTPAETARRAGAVAKVTCDPAYKGCGRKPGQQCVSTTGTGKIVAPHTIRKRDYDRWISRQAEIDQLASQVLGYKGQVASLTSSVQLVTADRDKALADKAALEVLFTNLSTSEAAHLALIAQLQAQVAELTEPPVPEPPATVYGMNVSPGMSFTNSTRESAADQVKRITATHGDLGVAKCFYQGALPATFNVTYEGLVPGRQADVCFKINPADLADGKYDAAIIGYVDSIPAGWKIMLTPWQEPDDEIWKDHTFTVAQFRAAVIHLYDLVHSRPAGQEGRAEVWPVFMEYSVSPDPKNPGKGGRWDDTVLPAGKVDGVFWDLYVNKDKSFKLTSWDMNLPARLDALEAIHERLGVEKWGIAETGDNPHPDGDGAARATAWTEFYDEEAARGASYVIYFNAIGTTGDHRILPGTAFGDPMVALQTERMTTSQPA